MNVWGMINQDLHGVSWWSPWWWAIIGLGPQRPSARVPALSGVFPSWIGGEDRGHLICTVMEAVKEKPCRLLWRGCLSLRAPVNASCIFAQPCLITQIARGEQGQHSSVLILSLWLGLITHIITLRLFLWVLNPSFSLFFFHLFSFLVHTLSCSFSL